MELRSPASRKRKKKRHIPEASVPQEAVNGLGALEVDTALGSPEVDVGKKKKKQELKQLEVMEPVAAESMAEMSEPVGAPFLSTTKKKKKKPKGAEMVEPEEQTLAPEEKPAELELTIKREPLEETVFPPSRKRKRQKGTEGREPGEGMPAESPLQLEPQEEANLLPSSKKKKKEKGYKVMMEPGTEAIELEMGPLEFPGEVMEPELPHEVEPQAEAALVSTKKRRKKEKWQNAAGEPGAEVVEPWVEPEPPGELEPQASTKKKKKKERGHKATEPRAETSDPQGEVLELQLPEEGEPEARADPVPTKKRKKRGQGSGMPETTSQEMLGPPLSLESGEEVAPAGWEKKRKKLQQDPV